MNKTLMEPVMKKSALALLLLSLMSSSAFADNGCRVYFDELAMLKTVKNFEVEHNRYAQIQLLENNLYRKGYRFTNTEDNATHRLEVFEVSEQNGGKCADSSLLLTNVQKGKSAVAQANSCSMLWMVPNTSAINAAKEAIAKLPECRKF